MSRKSTNSKILRLLESNWVNVHLAAHIKAFRWNLVRTGEVWSALSGERVNVLRFDAGALKRRTDARLMSRQSELSRAGRAAGPPSLLCPHAPNLWLRGAFPAACRVRPPPSLAASRCVNDLRKWQSAWWEMNVAGKQQPELNERPASLLVPTSVSRPACLRSFGTLTRFFMRILHVHLPPTFYKRLFYSR